MSLILPPHIVDEHTIEFGPDFPPKAPARSAWARLSRAFLADRFGGAAIYLAADWDRDGFWWFDETLVGERLLRIDTCEVRIVEVDHVDELFIDTLLRSSCYNWDGNLLIAHRGTDVELATHVRAWFDSINSAESLLRCPCDAIYPVADGIGMRYTNALKSVEELQADLRRVMERL